MKHLFPTSIPARQLALALSLLAAGPAAAQAPATVYALGTTTQAYGGFAAGAQLLAQINPTTQAYTPNSFFAITGLTAGQQLVGLDAQPSTGQLFALGYNGATGAAQLYTIAVTSNTAVATPVGPGFTLDLQDSNRSNTYGLVTNVGFDFNPRVDRIRVVAPNGTNYRLNPNTGTIAATDGRLAYVAGNSVGHAPYIGTAAYTNSVLNIPGTTLYDIDLTNTNGLLSTQAPPNDGVLNPVAPVTFAVNGSTTYSPLASPTIALSLDIAYDRTAAQNLAYVLEARYSDDPIAANRYASNFYAFDLATGKATGKNLFGLIPIFLYDIAAAVSLPKTWTGAVSTAWEEDGNWTPAGAPTRANDVFIPGAPARQPEVSNSAATKQALSVTLGNGAVLTTSDGGILNVYGSFANNDGTVTGSGTGTVALVGSSQQDIGGNAVSAFQNLSVGAAGAATTGPAAIVRALTLSGNLAIGTGQAFTLRSNAAGTAYVVNQGSAVASGIATVQRYIASTNAGQGYRHYSSPVSGNTVADFTTAGFTPSANDGYNSAANPRQFRPYPNVFTYDQARLATSNAAYAVGDFDNGFRSPADVSTPLSVGLGYAVNIAGTQLVDFQGPLNQNANYPVSGLARGAQVAAGYQLLGNPYPSAVNYDVVAGNSVGMESALYVYRSSGQFAGAYSTYVPPGPTNGGPGVGNGGGTNNLPVARGFFMRTAAGQTGSVTFSAAARLNTPETAAFQRTAAETRPTLSLTLGNASIANQTRVYFDHSATSAFDAQFDAHYVPATHGLDLASDISTETLAINGLPELKAAVIVPLQVHTLTAGTYTLAVDELSNLPTGYRAYLRDASTGTYTDLTTTPSLSLNLAPTDPATGRYAVVFSVTAPLATASATLSALAAVYPSPAHGAATLVLPQALRGKSASTVQLLNSLGQVVLTKTVAAGSNPVIELPLAGLAAGIYTVQATTEAGLVAKRLVVQ